LFAKRMATLQARMADNGMDAALITDDDSVYYFSGYYDYLHMEFGRPTILLVTPEHGSSLITPSMESHMAEAAAQVDQLAFWNDGMGEEWRETLPSALGSARRIGYEPDQMPPIVQNYLTALIDKDRLADVTPIVSDIRMIKSPDEIQLARHAGQVANAMMAAGRAAIGDQVPEYEIALATNAAGTRKAAELLEAHYKDTRMSPNTHFLQIMASGEEIAKPHHRASTRVMNKGEPVFLCFCGMTNFHRFKLGFDRTFWIGEIADKAQEDVYKVALASQAAALEKLRPGVLAEDIHAAYADVIQDAGYEYPFRCGRATGYSFLEKPQIVFGDKTEIQPGMVLAIDGSVTLDRKFRAQVGDSFVVTDSGYEQLTAHPNTLEDVIL
jgi:Xaa-Pro dipeptidase